MARSTLRKPWRIAVAVDGLFFPQRRALGLDARQSTPGFKRQAILLCAETRSYQRAAIVMRQVLGLETSPNTIERMVLEVGNDLEAAQQADWSTVLTGESTVPSLAIVEFDGGRIRTRKSGCGPGVHLEGKGWNETKNAIFVSATSAISAVDPEPEPPRCFLEPERVAQLAEQAKITENARSVDASPEIEPAAEADRSETQSRHAHRPKRLHRTVLASMKNSKAFGAEMAREARRRRFDEAPRKAFVADGLACNWSIHAAHFREYAPVLDFTHAVGYLFAASILCLGKTEAAWTLYAAWMTAVWRGDVDQVLLDLKTRQQAIGWPPDDAADDDPREQLRGVIQYLENNRSRMQYAAYRRQGLPTTSAWMESTVKEMNYRIKGTEMFWNNPQGAEAILKVRAAALSDDSRLTRLLTLRPGSATQRRTPAPNHRHAA
jgi:hypothetical protein